MWRPMVPSSKEAGMRKVSNSLLPEDMICPEKEASGDTSSKQLPWL